ncbi:MAG: hypothetical protein JST35_01595 [Armatimonadetes bacterium]|nr:hypothetical protein [Armatimonadota bacterium]
MSVAPPNHKFPEGRPGLSIHQTVVQVIIDVGEDMEAERQITHYFITKKIEEAREILRSLPGNGSARINERTRFWIIKSYQIEYTLPIILSLDTIDDHIRAVQFSSRTGAESYDGWDVNAVNKKPAT